MVQMQLAATAETSADAIYDDVYSRLKAMASRQRLRGGAPRTLCTTELVHEAYLRMGDSNFRYQQSAQFFAYAARAMRHILTDAARRRIQPKRGGDQARIDLTDPAVEAAQIDPQQALQLDEALTALESEDARAAQRPVATDAISTTSACASIPSTSRRSAGISRPRASPVERRLHGMAPKAKDRRSMSPIRKATPSKSRGRRPQGRQPRER